MDEKITRYINDPIINKLTAPENKLYRPEINYHRATAWSLLVILLSVVISLCIVIEYERFMGDYKVFNIQWVKFVIILPAVVLFNIIVYLKYIMIWFVRIYQKYALSEVRLRCRFEPSCSEYAILAIQKYGPIHGGLKSIARLKRCKPPGGIDFP
ncbi:MAG: membrane protein insertion efficiency factor YidD [Bacteroidota bacterium]